MATWQVGSKCIVYCASDDKWYDDGNVTRISGNYVKIVFKNGSKHKQMKMSSVSKYLAPLNEDNLKLQRGSNCFIYSLSKWCKGKVIDVYLDKKQQEWLMVQYKDEGGLTKIMDIRRHSAFINALANGQMEQMEKTNRETNMETLETKQQQKLCNYTSPESTAEPEPIEY